MTLNFEPFGVYEELVVDPTLLHLTVGSVESRMRRRANDHLFKSNAFAEMALRPLGEAPRLVSLINWSSERSGGCRKAPAVRSWNKAR